MSEGTIRFLVRDAMRASLLTEHKLVLQEFVATPAGRTLVNAGAMAIGVTGDSLGRVIASLPPMDFYVPGAAHRKSWRGDGQVLVAAALARDISQLTATRSDRARQLIRQQDRVGGTPLFLLQPAERKSRRIGPQLSRPGLTIQDPGDGEISGTLVEYRRDGTTRVTELADYFALQPRFSETSTCDPNTSLEPCPSEDVGSGGGTITPDTTYLQHVVIIGVCDNGDCSQGNEFEWRTYFSSNNGATYGSRYDLRVEGVPSNFEGTWNFPALLKKIRNPQDFVKSDVVETDWSSPDDHFNPSPTWGYQQ